MGQDPARVRACYDVVAGNYASRFKNELDEKPFDRKKLDRFAASVEGRVLDLGCGCGHIGAYLASRGADVFGVDLSSGQIEQGRRLFPGLELRTGNMLDLDLADASVAGIAAFYSIVHFTPEQLATAAREMHRVLEPGGRLLLSFHIGAEVVSLEEFLDRHVEIDFMFFEVEEVVDCLRRAGFAEISFEERGPYPEVESQTTRAYVSARAA